MEPVALPPPPQPTAAAAEHQHSLPELLATETAWSRALYLALDQPARVNLSKANRQCQQWVQQTADSATATLITYGGQPEATWRRRLAGVERGLRARQQRANRLVVRVQTPNPVALQSLLAIAGPASGAITELEMQQVSSPEAPDQGVSTQWLAGLPAAFPNLRVLSLSGLCGTLPPPAQLPHLRDLHVRVCPSTHPDYMQVLGSVALYTAQLTSLSIREHDSDSSPLPYARVFTAVSHSLTSVGVGELTEQLIKLLRTRVPNLRHLSFDDTGDHIGRDHAQATWGVREISGYNYPANLAKLPSSPEGLELSCAYGGSVSLCFKVVGSQGLPDAVRQRLPSWRVRGKCRVSLEVGQSLSLDEKRAGLLTAVRQLQSFLPPGSELRLLAHSQVFQVCPHELLTSVYQTIATMAPELPNVTLVPPFISGPLGAVWGCYQVPPVPQAALRISRSDSYAHLPWPWRCLIVDGPSCQDLLLTDLLKLPETSNGQYDIDISGLSIGADKVTPAVLAQLQERARHLTIIIREFVSFEIVAADTDPARHPAMLRMVLKVVNSFGGWRCEPGCAPDITLKKWSLTPAVFHELRALPDLGFRVSLEFEECDWSACTDYEALTSLVSTLPACYTLGHISTRGKGPSSCTVQHLQALCLGAAQRPARCRKSVLTLSLGLGKHVASDAERSALYRYIEEQGLEERIEVIW